MIHTHKWDINSQLWDTKSELRDILTILRWDPWTRHRTPNFSPGARSINGCPLLRLCVHGVCVCLFTTHCCVCALGWVKCRTQIQSVGHHTWPNITSLPSLQFWEIKTTARYKLFWEQSFFLSAEFDFITRKWVYIIQCCEKSHNCKKSRTSDFITK